MFGVLAAVPVAVGIAVPSNSDLAPAAALHVVPAVILLEAAAAPPAVLTWMLVAL